MSYHRRRREHKAWLNWTLKRLRERRRAIRFAMATGIAMAAAAQINAIRSAPAITAELKLKKAMAIADVIIKQQVALNKLFGTCFERGAT